MIGQEDKLADPRFATREARAQHEAEIDAMIGEWTMRYDKHEAMRLIGAAGVPAGAVLDTGDLLAEPSFAERGIIQTMQHPNGRSACRLFPCGSTARRPRSSPRRSWANTQPKSSPNGSANADEVEKLRGEGIV